jgi:hypothetical protein
MPILNISKISRRTRKILQTERKKSVGAVSPVTRFSNHEATVSYLFDISDLYSVLLLAVFSK